MSQAPTTRRRLIYDGIELVMSDDTGEIFCLTTDALWCLPGGEVASTNELVRRATQRGVLVQLATIKGLSRELVPLN